MFHIVVSTKGGVGKSTLAKEVVATSVFASSGKKVRLVEIDDHNKSAEIISGVVSLESFSVSAGIEETQKALFEVFNDEDVVLDAGGGNDTNILLDSISGLGISDKCVFYIPVLKNKSGMKNLLDVYHRIRSKSSSRIIIILNQSKSYDNASLKSEFAYFFGDISLNITGAFSDIYLDENLGVATIHDTNVFDLAESYKLTAYEIASENISEDFLKVEQKKGYANFRRALAYLNVCNLCKEYKEKTLDKFYEECRL